MGLSDIETLRRWSAGLVGWFRPPIKAKVTEFYFMAIDNDEGGIVVATPYPRRYYCELDITNRADKTVYIQSITVTIDDDIRLESTLQAPIEIKPHQPLHDSVIFPVENRSQERDGGIYVLELTPSIGPPLIIRDCYP